MIPSRDKFKFGNYNTSDGSDYAPEGDQPSDYPVTREPNVKVGSDPIYSELKAAYGEGSLYGMHWIIDTDNAYGFGECGDGKTKPAYINTFQRGAQESTWETVTQPSCENFKFGSANGFLPIFMKEDSYSKQWRFTDAPDADARAVQAAYWALTWAKEQGKASAVSATVAKAAKMGDYLRYAMYDKHFKKPGCTSPSCPAATGKEGSTYLISWYYAWGGAMDGAWAFLIGSSGFHQGYQNPLAAYVLSTVPELTPKGATAKQDWATATKRQVEFLTWLQSAEGAFAGGANNSWNGRYEAGEGPRFYGLAYDWAPVWRDPPSNRWFGFQAWGIERLAEYYYLSKDAKTKPLLDKWVKWALSHTTVADGDVQFPNDLTWTGTPSGNWTSSSSTVNNTGLHVTVENYTNDLGVTGAYARLLTYYSAATGNKEAATMAKALLDSVLTRVDAKGFAVEETRKDYNRFGKVDGDDALYVPSGFTGKMPNGDVINSESTFISIRTFMKKDPEWKKVQSYLDGGDPPTFTYHRFWAQVDVGTALADYARLIDAPAAK
jgi:Glycosyl hydrolase family 48